LTRQNGRGVENASDAKEAINLRKETYTLRVAYKWAALAYRSRKYMVYIIERNVFS
jgi:hypothetical protein